MKQVYLFIVFIFFSALLYAQPADSVIVQKDSLVIPVRSLSPLDKYDAAIKSFLAEHQYLNSKSESVTMQNKVRTNNPQLFFFYLMAGIVLFLAFIKYLYTRYFNNMFRVFFNTSLRQSQLTDQLLQSKQASLLFNVLFVITGGIYIYFLLQHNYSNVVVAKGPVMVLLACVFCLALIYVVKFLSLKFTGWLTGYNSATNTYLFVIFLINKIIGILLVPVIIILAFSSQFLVQPVVIISIVIIVLMLLQRFLRSYGLLQNQLKVSRLHFFIYIIGAEILPLFLIYKSLMILLNKNP